jgi:peptide/nickel transport system substrate-binding protein
MVDSAVVVNRRAEPEAFAMSRDIPRRTRVRTRRGWAALAAAAALGLAAAAAAPAALAADSPSAAATVPAGSGNTLRVASDTQITTFNPFTSYYDGELNIIGAIYPALMQLDKDGTAVPYLAESYTTSDDQLTWTFKIRQGLKWTDGTPITAQDAAWTFNLIMSNDTAASANGSLVKNFASVTAPDDSTLVITTKTPQANMLYLSVPISGIVIVPKHVWESRVAKIGDELNMEFPVVGYGPWILTGNVTNEYTTLSANKDYYAGAPKFDTLISQYYSSSDAAVAALQAGDLDELSGLTAAQYKALSSASGVTTYQTKASGWTAIEVNSGAATRTGKAIGTGNPALKNDKVRQAIALGIDRPTLVSKVLGGLGIAGAGYLPPGYPTFFWTPSKTESLAYDPTAAGKLLDEAGYTAGSDGMRIDPATGKGLSLTLGIHSDSSTDALIAPYLTEWMKAIGIDLKVEPMSFDTLNNNLAKGDWDLLMDGWSTGPDPTYLLSIQTCDSRPLDDGTSGSTDAFFCDPEYDALNAKQITQFDTAERVKTIGQMQSKLYAANADVILFYKNRLSAVRTDKVSGFVQGSADSDGFYPLQHGVSGWVNATPVVAAAGSSSSSMVAGLVAVVVVVLGGGGAFIWLRRRRSTAGDRE